ncbi:MAG: TlpA disulfide reductase family protein [Kofleriaceae bacterium]
MLRHILATALVVSGCSKPAPATGAGSGEGAAEAFVRAPHDALVGHRAPAVTLELLDGTHVELAKLIGQRPIYLKFWATWCVPCREQMPHLEATFRDHGDQLAVYAVDVAINDPIENVRKFVAQKHLTVPVAIDRDGSVAEQFDLNVTPQHVLIDRAGVVRYVGHAITPELERAIADLVDPTRAPAPATPAVAAPPGLPPLALDNGSKFDFASRPHAPLALTFATLFCDSYIAESRPEIGAACAAHAHKIEEVHRAHPELTWITVAFPVWTGDDDIREYRKRLGATLPIGIDRGNAWFHRFGVRDSYTTVLFDAAGTELGRVDGDGAGLPALIDKALVHR